MAYILTGIILVQFAVLNNETHNTLEILAELGIALPLFVLGLEFKLLELKSIGKVAIVAGLSHIFVGTILGFLVCSLLGFASAEALFVSFALTFSSTIVAVKLLSDNKELTSLHGKISIGMVLVQDLFAILVLVLLSTHEHGQVPDTNTFMLTLIKLIFLIALTIAFSQVIFPRLISSISSSSEILFVSSLAWAFGLVALVSSPIIGFPVEIGAFLAGLALANTSESTQIISKVKSLRDFFLVLFFVTLGTSLNLGNLGEVIIPALIISVFVIVATPIVVMTVLGLFGYKARTSFLTGLTIAQISEFSLVFVLIGKEIGQVTDRTISLVTVVAIITFSVSSYLISNSDKVFDFFAPSLKIFQKKGKEISIYTATKDLDNHIVLLGADRMGRSMLRTLKDMKDDILVMDFNPDITKALKDDGYNVIFGDIADEDILVKAQVGRAKVILSTIPDYEDNLILLTFLNNQLRNQEKRPIVIVTAHADTDKEGLKEAGANYVIMPYQSAGKYLGHLIKSGQIDELQ
ncbi:MAG: cation:proton antiporter [Candidatus Dojkabacteria bacterium]